MKLISLDLQASSTRSKAFFYPKITTS